jgi:hypothetical protein
MPFEYDKIKHKNTNQYVEMLMGFSRVKQKRKGTLYFIRCWQSLLYFMEMKLGV